MSVIPVDLSVGIESFDAFKKFETDFFCTKIDKNAEMSNIVPGEYNSPQSEVIPSKPRILFHVKSIACVVKSLIQGTTLVSSNRPTTIKYGDQAENKVMVLFSLLTVKSSCIASCHSSLGMNQPFFAVKVAMINPVNAAKMATNSGPNSEAYNKAEAVYVIPINKVHGNTVNASRIPFPFPKKRTSITININGINVPANKSINVTLEAISLKKALFAPDIIHNPTITSVTTAPNATAELSATNAITTAANGLKPSASNKGAVTIAGVPKPAAPSMTEPNKKATRTAWTRISPDIF